MPLLALDPTSYSLSHIEIVFDVFIGPDPDLILHAAVGELSA